MLGTWKALGKGCSIQPERKTRHWVWHVGQSLHYQRNSELLNKQVNSDMKNKIKLGVVAFTLIPIIKRLRQEDWEHETNLTYKLRSLHRLNTFSRSLHIYAVLALNKCKYMRGTRFPLFISRSNRLGASVYAWIDTSWTQAQSSVKRIVNRGRVVIF